MKVKVSLKVGRREYIEDVSELLELSNSPSFFREIETTSDDLENFNTSNSNAHFIYGWFESFAQSDNIMEWLYEADKIYIKVYHEE